MKLKRLILTVLAALLVFPALSPLALAEESREIQSEAYIVIDAKTGQVLAERNSRVREYPASITKILTAAMALENGNLDDVVTMTDEAVWSVGRDTTHIALTPGEEVPVRSLLYATMLASANDAANGLATYVGGDLQNFVRLMNQKAEEAGAADSNFVNSNGLHDLNHYTTAYDMAMITKWALTVDGFSEVFGAESYTMPPTNKQPEPRLFGTYHMMIVESAFTYDGAWGGKLGWTPEALHTMVTVAERDGVELICVVLKCKNQYDKFRDTAALFDQCFAEYQRAVFSIDELTAPPMTLTENGKQVGTLSIFPQEVEIALPPGVTKEDVILNYRLKDSPDSTEWEPSVGFRDLAGNELCRVDLGFAIDSAASAGAGGAVVVPAQRRIGWPMRILIGLGIFAAALFVFRSYNIAKRRRRRIEQRERRRREMGRRGI